MDVISNKSSSIGMEDKALKAPLPKLPGPRSSPEDSGIEYSLPSTPTKKVKSEEEQSAPGTSDRSYAVDVTTDYSSVASPLPEIPRRGRVDIVRSVMADFQDPPKYENPYAIGRDALSDYNERWRRSLGWGTAGVDYRYRPRRNVPTVI